MFDTFSFDCTYILYIYLLITYIVMFIYRWGPYFVEPVIAGLDPKTNEPFISNFDTIGCESKPEGFCVAGTCEEQLYGMCESLWKPDLEPEDLFETISQTLLNAVDRDAYSGWGAVVHVLYVALPS